MISLRRIFSLEKSQTVFECRRCGTNVDEGTEVCPECDSDEIIHYDL